MELRENGSGDNHLSLSDINNEINQQSKQLAIQKAHSSNIDNANDKSEYNLNDLIGNYRITTETDLPPIESLISIGDEGSIFVAKGDISFLTGQAKAGKTTIISFMIGSCLRNDLSDSFDTLKIKGLYCGDKPIIYVDTEQSKQSTKKLAENICKIFDLDKLPDKVFLLNYAEFDRKERFNRVKELFKYFKDAHLWFIDGVADLISDVNNTTESNDVIDFFRIKASMLNTGIVLCLHENPNSNKMRGNLGSEAERKCAGAISVKKDRLTKTHKLEARLIRHSKDFDDVNFHYSNSEDRMVTMGTDSVAKLTQINKENDTQIKISKLRELAKKCIVIGDTNIPIGYENLISRIMKNDNPRKGISKATADKRRAEMMSLGIITLNDEKKYKYVEDETQNNSNQQEKIPF